MLSLLYACDVRHTWIVILCFVQSDDITILPLKDLKNQVSQIQNVNFGKFERVADSSAPYLYDQNLILSDTLTLPSPLQRWPSRYISWRILSCRKSTLIEPI